MEKQPIDDFFARRLREAEQLPSPGTFSRLQSRMVSTELPQKHRRTAAIWWYTAAASLLLITLFVYWKNVKTPLDATAQVSRVGKTEKSMTPGPVQKASQLMAKSGKNPSPQQATVLEEKVKGKQPSETSTVPSTQPQLLPDENEAVTTVATATVPEETSPVKTVQPAFPVTAKSIDQQRVVVLTIDVPDTEAPIVALQPTKVESTAQAQTGSLAGLFAKVKQLKTGDMLARATPTRRPAEPRSRIGRMFDGMKESLKNETTLE